ncbi:MAG: sugar O-acetyltransferase [Cyanobacteria bacterium J06597_1]
MSMSEKTKMLAGELYNAFHPDLVRERSQAKTLCRQFKDCFDSSVGESLNILKRVIAVGDSCWIEPPFRCDYGSNIAIGDNFYANFGCVILDCNRVTIGNNVKLGPNVHLYTATHPIDPKLRLEGLEMAYPIAIGSNVWIGGGTIVLAGVTIGDNVTIGAGSIVTKDIPPNVVAVGSPCRPLRRV